MKKKGQESIIVSVCCITYNHGPFIREAIEGFLMQQTTFPIEIIIHDDASTDNTQAIIQEYADKDDRIIPVLRKENIKSTGVAVFPITYKMARGKYIALCEGDDYWTDPLKLQKQVDFLESNPTYSFCFHDVDMVDKSGIILKKNISPAHFYRGATHFSSQRILAGPMVINTCSLVFRNSPRLLENIKNAPQLPYGDKLLEKLLALEGDGYFFKEVWGHYRKHGSSITHSTEWNRTMIKKSIPERHILLTYLSTLSQKNQTSATIKLVLEYNNMNRKHWMSILYQLRMIKLIKDNRSSFTLFLYWTFMKDLVKRFF